MAVQTLSEALDNLYTTTWLHMKSEAIDNIFSSIPFWAWMKENNRMKSVVGGRQILEAVEYGKNDDVAFIGKGGTVPLNDREFLTQAVWDWHYLVVPIVRFGTDDQKNRGKTKIMDLMSAKLNNAKSSLTDKLENALFATATGTVGGAFAGLRHLVQDDPTAAVSIGGINQATYTWWQNQFFDDLSATFNAGVLQNMRHMLNACMNNRSQDKPDIIVTDQLSYELYEGVALPVSTYAGVLRVQNTKMLDLGFDSQAFKNIPMVWSPECPATKMYFLNTKFLFYIYDPGMNFDMTDWKSIPDQVNDRAAQIVSACSFVTNRRRTQGVLFGLPVT